MFAIKVSTVELTLRGKQNRWNYQIHLFCFVSVRISLLNKLYFNTRQVSYFWDGFSYGSIQNSSSSERYSSLTENFALAADARLGGRFLITVAVAGASKSLSSDVEPSKYG